MWIRYQSASQERGCPSWITCRSTLSPGPCLSVCILPPTVGRLNPWESDSCHNGISTGRGVEDIGGSTSCLWEFFRSSYPFQVFQGRPHRGLFSKCLPHTSLVWRMGDFLAWLDWLRVYSFSAGKGLHTWMLPGPFSKGEPALASWQTCFQCFTCSYWSGHGTPSIESKHSSHIQNMNGLFCKLSLEERQGWPRATCPTLMRVTNYIDLQSLRVDRP